MTQPKHIPRNTTAPTTHDTQWVNFLHIYQPAWQDAATFLDITRKSYEHLIATFERFPDFNATINVAGVLLEMLERHGRMDLIERLGALIKKGQLELTGSAYHHPFLPRLSPDEIERQLHLQAEALARYFNGYSARGFFAPEMAYSTAIGDAAKKYGYEWIILDPISCTHYTTNALKYLSRKTGLTVVFRDRAISRAYPPEVIYKALAAGTAAPVYITATDGELYGFQHDDWQHHLETVIGDPRVSIVTVSAYLSGLRDRMPVYLRSASWETREHHIRSNNPFTVWYNRNNVVHRKLWQLADLAQTSLTEHKKDPNYAWARAHLDRGLGSCTWWWASEFKTSPFAPIGWNPDNVLRGAEQLIRSIRSLHTLTPEKKIAAEKLYARLIEIIWTIHWKRYGNTNIR